MQRQMYQTALPSSARVSHLCLRAVLGLGLLASQARADSNLHRLGWDLTFHDDFDGAAVDPSKWSMDDHGFPANNELQYYTPDAVYQENSVLVLKSDRNFNPSRYNGREFISGKVTTAGRFAQKYGYFETRAIVPGGTGIWPAHWMLPYNHWPPEIDFMEMIGSVPNNIRMSVHRGNLPPGCIYPWECGHTSGGDFWGPDMTLGWHTYAVEWDWWGCVFYIDDVPRASVHGGTPDEPMFMILNTAVGGNWPGYPWGTSFPRYHILDYARVWQRCDGRRLLNAGFEQGDHDRFPDWNTYDTGNIVCDDLSANAHGGGRAVQLHGRFNGGDNRSGLYQDLFASPGEMVRGAFWLLNRPGDEITGDNTARIKIEFYDGDLALLDRRDFVAADRDTANGYRLVELREVAPADSARARLVLEFAQSGNSPGAVVADDAEFSHVTPFSARPLLDPGFESADGNDFAVWKTHGAVLRETSVANPAEGLGAVRFPEGGGVPPGFAVAFQDVPTREGEEWVGSVRARHRAGEPLTGSSQAFLRLEFVDSSGVVLATNQVQTIAPASPGGYGDFTVQGLAPDHAVFARLVIGLISDGMGGGSLVCDQAGLVPRGEEGFPRLLNRDFELHNGTNFLAWTRYSAVTGNVRNEALPANARGGLRAPWMFGQFPGGGSANVSGLFQDLPASPGQVWEASVWGRNRPGDGLEGENRGRLKLEFLDGSGGRIDQDQFTLVRSSSPAEYRQALIRRVAPAGSAQARIVLEMSQVANAEGSLNFDDADLRQLTVQDDRTLSNGDFETVDGTGFLNWSEYGNVLPNITPESSPANIREGSGAAKVFGQFPAGGVSNQAGVFQDVPVAPGEMWMASVWAKNRAGDALQGSNRAVLKLEFLSSAGAGLQTNALTAVRAGDSQTTWAFRAVRARAPAQAARARIVLELRQSANAGGAVDFDSAEMRLATSADADRPLLNGGFEQGINAEFASWHLFGAAGLGNLLRDPVAGSARTGAHALQVHGTFAGTPNQSGLFQDIPARPGELWEASIWARNRPGDSLEGANAAAFKLEFVNTAGAVVQAKSHGILGAASPATWREFVLRDRAPPGTAFARIAVVLTQVNLAAGSIHLDDARLRVITAGDGTGLANAGLEDVSGSAFLNWSAYGNGIGNVLRDPLGNARDGASALQIYGEGTGSRAYSGLHQGVPAREGQLWQASCWARNRPGDALQGSNQASLKLEFLDGAGAFLASHPLTVVDAGSPASYREHAILASAPPATAEARVALEYRQDDFQGGSANVDQLSLRTLTGVRGTQSVQRVLLAGRHTPGDQDTVLFAGDLILDATTALDLDIGGAPGAPRFDRLVASGSCTLGGALTVRTGQHFPPNHIPRLGDRLELIRAAALGGMFASFSGPPGIGGGNAFALETTATNLSLRVVSELDSDGDTLPDFWEQQYFNSVLGGEAGGDGDGDRLDNRGEYVAGTGPTDGSSVFRVSGDATPGGRVLRWPSAPGRSYNLFSTTNLVTGSWLPVLNNVPATPPMNTFPIPDSTPERILYKIETQLAP